MPKIRSVLFLLFIIAGYTAACQNNYEDGKNEYFNGDVNKAIILFTNAIESRQNMAAAYMMRGAAKGKIGDFNGAVKDLDESRSLDSLNYKLFFYYGRVCLVNNIFKMALSYYDTAIKINSKDADSYDDRAMTRIELDDYRGGITDENVAIEIDPKNASYYINRGYAKMQLAEYKEAIADYDKSITISPSHKALANRGFAFLQLGAYQPAIEDFTQALEFYPKDHYVFYYRGLAYKGLGKKDQACSDCKTSAGLGNLKAAEDQKSVCPL